MALCLLSVSSDAKTVKGQTLGFLTGILYLSPASISGRNLCPFATNGCEKACLNTAGRGANDTPIAQAIHKGRARKTSLYFDDPTTFWAQLHKDVGALVRKCNRESMRPAVRLNGTSDILWENKPEFRALCAEFPTVRFYDYTKYPVGTRKNLPENYDLTFSRGEGRDAQALDALLAGMRVAIVFSTRKSESLPATWNGFEVINGDETDLRFLDPASVVVGLRAKGQAKQDTSGFVVKVQEMELAS